MVFIIVRQTGVVCYRLVILIIEAVAGTSGIAGSDLKGRMELIMSYRASDPRANTPRILLGRLGAAMTIVPLLDGFLQQSVVHAQTAARNQLSTASAQQGACMYHSV